MGEEEISQGMGSVSRVEDWGHRAVYLEARLEDRTGDLAREQWRARTLEAERADLQEDTALATEERFLEACQAELRQKAEALGAEAAALETRETLCEQEGEDLLHRRAVFEACEDGALALAAAEAGVLGAFHGRLDQVGTEIAVDVVAQSTEAQRLELEADILRCEIK